MIRRPKPGDEEEDLLSFQNEFLASSTTPAASVIRQSGKRSPSQPDCHSRGVLKDVVILDAGDLCLYNI